MEQKVDAFLNRYVWYRDLDLWLRKNGARFHFGEKMNGLRYVFLCVLLSAAGVGGLWSLGPGEAVVGGTVLLLLPHFLVMYLNRQDNTKLLPELKLLYHGLEIQIRAGVYVTDALTEMYACVREKRLGKALVELAGDIVMHGNVEEALEELRCKFDNSYIDSLCMIVLQTLESGQAVELLSDLTEQIKDMEAAVFSKKKEALNRSITLYQLLILAAVLVIVLFACVTKMFASALHF